jgi:alanyl-tRNA synthetase
LGEHVTQKGSLVADDRLRFDFSHLKPLSDEDIAAIEFEVNSEIRANEPVSTTLMSPDDAVEAGALALFGEKYGDEVRVLSMGRKPASGRSYSVELCGGTHVKATGDIGIFRIVSEGAVSSGVRRIEALTGDAARSWLVNREEALKQAASAIRATPEEVPARISALLDERKRLEKELAEAKKALALGGGSSSDSSGGGVEEIGSVKFYGQVIEGLSPKELKPLADEKRNELGSAVVTLIACNPNANTVVQSATLDLAEKFDSTKLVRVATEAMGGKGGGGRPDMAQGGGPAGKENAEEAIAAIRLALKEAVP